MSMEQTLRLGAMRSVNGERVADVVTLNRHDNEVTLRFLSREKARRQGGFEVNLPALVAEELLTMLSREFDEPAW